MNEYQAKTLELIGFNRIVSEAQAYQISRNLIKAFKNTPDLNKLTAPSYVVHLLNKIKVGSYFKYKKVQVRCKAVSKDGTPKKKFASVLLIADNNLSVVDMFAFILDARYLELASLHCDNLYRSIACKDYESVYNSVKDLYENQKKQYS